MRYRRLRYRYALVLAAEHGTMPSGGLRPIGDAWRTERPGFMLAQTTWRPPADVYETEAAITVTVELAGVDHEELDVQLFDDAVVVEGERRLPRSEAQGVYHAAELRQGRFRLELGLPAPIDPERVTAEYDRGLLQIVFMKLEG